MLMDAVSERAAGCGCDHRFGSNRAGIMREGKAGS
jgi:hypothetical protein